MYVYFLLYQSSAFTFLNIAVGVPTYQQPPNNATNNSKQQQLEQPQEAVLSATTPANNSYSIFKSRGGKMGN